MKNKYLLGPVTSVLALSFAMSTAHAKVSSQEAQKLGSELTCVGAEASGNADGTIPPFTGEYMGKLPGNVNYTPHVGQHPVNPFANEQPKFVINGSNWRDYQDKLSEGQQALFQRYPDKFEMPVYESKRIFSYPQQVCDIAKRNATEAELTDGGLGYTGYKGGTPFPIPSGPDKALQVLFNLTFPYLAYTEVMEKRDIAEVSASGNITWGQTKNTGLNMTTKPEEMGKPVGGVMAYNNTGTLKPTRNKGSATVSSEPMNFTNDRLAWNYNPGTRRVRQLPEYGFDSAASGTSGKVTIDQDRLMNGSPIRYNWTLLGKKEIYVPINTYRLHTEDVSYDALLQPDVPNPDFMRYELRRVWVLEGALKNNYRHKYGKRVLFIDEDSWHGLMSDYYDTRGQLVQHGVVNYYYTPDTNAFHAGTSFYYDLKSGGYVAYNLFQDLDKGPILNAGGLTPDMFTPASLRARSF
nr:DUF1329 domain-containing protein [uncultured Halomonas sp.]